MAQAPTSMATSVVVLSSPAIYNSTSNSWTFRKQFTPSENIAGKSCYLKCINIIPQVTTGSHLDALSTYLVDLSFPQSVNVTHINTPLDYSTTSSTVTITAANPGVVTWTSHGLRTGDRISFSTTGSLPANIIPGENYYVTVTGANTFNIYDAYSQTAQYQSTAGAVNTTAIVGAPVFSIASPTVITDTDHNYRTGSTVQFTTTGTLPTGVSLATSYVVTRIDKDSYTIATTAGVPVNVTAGGTGAHTSTSYTTGTHTAEAVTLSVSASSKVIPFRSGVIGAWFSPGDVSGKTFAGLSQQFPRCLVQIPHYASEITVELYKVNGTATVTTNLEALTIIAEITPVDGPDKPVLSI